MREQVLSTLNTRAAHLTTPGTGAPDNSQQRHAPDLPEHSPVTPANPTAYRGSASLSRAPTPWRPAAGSPVAWATPQEPQSAERRYAELEAARLSALAVQSRQTETIHRLASQLARAERLEWNKDRVPPLSRQRSAPRRKKTPRPRQDWVRLEEPSEYEDDDDSRDLLLERGAERVHRRVVPSSARHTHERSGHGASSSKRPPPRSRSASKGVSWPSDAKPRSRTKSKSAVKAAIDDDPEFLAVRRKVLSLNTGKTLEEENSSLREENARAKEDAKLFTSFVTDIRRSFSSILADRDELMSLMQTLRPRNEQQEQQHAGIADEPPSASAESPARVPADAKQRDEPAPPNLCTPKRDSHTSPTDVRFPGFETPTPCRPGPGRGENSSARELTAEFAEADFAPNMENELRAELRMVLEENAVLSERLSEHENRAALEDRLKNHSLAANCVQVELSALQYLRSEVLVLASIADSLRFEAGDGCTQSRASITHCGEGSTTKLALAFNSADSDTALVDAGDVRQIAIDIAHVRRTLAIKYGEWLSVAPLLKGAITRHNGDYHTNCFTDSKFEEGMFEDSGTARESTSAASVT